MNNIIDDLQENGFLYFLTFTPVIISFLFVLLLQIPIVGTVWLYAAPFTMLFYWAWVGSVFREKIKSPIRAILIGNIFGIILMLIYIWQILFLAEDSKNLALSYLSRFFSLPLEFITMWMGILLEPNREVTTVITMNIVQFAGFVLMVVAFIIGYFVKKKSSEKGD